MRWHKGGGVRDVTGGCLGGVGEVGFGGVGVEVGVVVCRQDFILPPRVIGLFIHSGDCCQWCDVLGSDLERANHSPSSPFPPPAGATVAETRGWRRRRMMVPPTPPPPALPQYCPSHTRGCWFTPREYSGENIRPLSSFCQLRICMVSVLCLLSVCRGSLFANFSSNKNVF